MSCQQVAKRCRYRRYRWIDRNDASMSPGIVLVWVVLVVVVVVVVTVRVGFTVPVSVFISVKERDSSFVRLIVDAFPNPTKCIFTCRSSLAKCTPIGSNERRSSSSNSGRSSSFLLLSSSSSLFTQVISDVDDTLKSSGGVNVAGVALGGIDVQYQRGEIYPGVAEFMLQISLGPNYNNHKSGTSSTTSTTATTSTRKNNRNNPIINNNNNNTPPPFSPPKIAILTARAEEFKLLLELKDTNPLSIAFRRAGERRGIQGWGIGPVLYGSVAEWIVQDRKGLRKFTNFERLVQQDPTTTYYGSSSSSSSSNTASSCIMNYVYVGDTGELDQQAGEAMLREYPHLVKAVFLHSVSGIPREPIETIPTKSTTTSTSTTATTKATTTTKDNDKNILQNSTTTEFFPLVPIPPPKLINGRPIVFFRTYVGAATAALQLGLIHPSGLDCVIEDACQQLASVPTTSDKWIDLYYDIDIAESVLLSTQTLLG